MVMPLTLGLAFVWIGLLKLRSPRPSKAGWLFAAAGLILLTLTGFSVFANRFAGTLEDRYQPLESFPQAAWVVVLGGGHVDARGVPPSHKLGGSSLARLVEGIRILREIPESRLLLSGGAVFEETSVAETMAQTALMLGVPQERILLESKARDTAEQAEAIKKIVQKEPLVLVTSALHMRRSILLFEQRGMRPIPAPCDYLGLKSPWVSPLDFFPRAGEMAKVEAVLHEALGILWYSISSRLEARFAAVDEP
ncbi:MAG: ElyC/SanA/YdcF family protein [Desulfobacterales bacterium]